MHIMHLEDFQNSMDCKVIKTRKECVQSAFAFIFAKSVMLNLLD